MIKYKSEDYLESFYRQKYGSEYDLLIKPKNVAEEVKEDVSDLKNNEWKGISRKRKKLGVGTVIFGGLILILAYKILIKK